MTQSVNGVKKVHVSVKKLAFLILEVLISACSFASTMPADLPKSKSCCQEFILSPRIFKSSRFRQSIGEVFRFSVLPIRPIQWQT